MLSKVITIFVFFRCSHLYLQRNFITDLRVGLESFYSSYVFSIIYSLFWCTSKLPHSPSLLWVKYPQAINPFTSIWYLPIIPPRWNTMVTRIKEMVTNREVLRERWFLSCHKHGTKKNSLKFLIIILILLVSALWNL